MYEEPTEPEPPKGNLLSRMARRRRRLAEGGNPQKSKKLKLEEWRVNKAAGSSVETNVELKVLKPGLSLAGCEKKVYTLVELQSMGLTTVPWTGS